MGKLQELLEDNGVETRSYSGRCMYGRTCLGVDCDGLEDLLIAVASGVNDDNREDVVYALRGLRSDSMGMGVIVYFPNVEYDDPDAEDEELDACASAG